MLRCLCNRWGVLRAYISVGRPVKSSTNMSHFHPTTPAVGGHGPEVILSFGSIYTHQMNYGGRKSGVSEQQGRKCLLLRARPRRLARFISSHPRPPLRPPPPPSHSWANQQICNLPVVMNRGLLQPRLPPQAQMDDCGPLKCFLHHSGWHTQGK